MEDVDEDNMFEGASSLLARALALKEEGNYSEAEALLEAGYHDRDEAVAWAYINLLAETHQFALVQSCLKTMISSLPLHDRPSDLYLFLLLNQAERMCLPPPPMNALLHYVKTLKNKNDRINENERGVRRRQYFAGLWRSRIAGVTLISLGTNCLPWTLANRWGFRDETKFLSEYNPFCQAIHKYDGVVNALREGFETYVTPDQVRVVNSAKGYQVPMRRDRTVIWSHTKGHYWVDEECRHLRAAVDVQIDNFRKSYASEKTVFFLGNYLEPDLEPLKPLKDALRSVTGRDENYLIVTNQRAPEQGHKLVHADEYTSYFSCPYPARTYAPAMPRSFNTTAGIDFELIYARKILTCLARWNIVEPPPGAPAGSSAGSRNLE